MFSNINFKMVLWKQTLVLHVLRAFAAGLVWAVIVLLFGGWNTAVLGLPFMMAASYVVTLPLAIVVGKILTAMVGDVGFGLVMLLFTIGIVVGDPLVYLLHAKKPGLVPVEKFRFLNFNLVVFVLDPARA